MAYTTSKEYEKIIYSGEATGNRIRIWFNGVELEDADNYCEKLSASSRLLPSSSSNRFSLDNFVSKELTLILHEVSLDKIVDQVKISLGTLVNGEYEDIPLGVFNIQDKPITDKDKITIKLRDNAIKFDFNYNAKPIIDSNGGSATKLQIFKDICSKAGVKTKVTSFANSSDLIGIYDNTIKARAYIYYLAEQCGAIPTIDRDGELIFVYINNLKVQRIPLSSIERFEIGNKYKISKVIYEDAIRKYQSGNDDYDKLFLNSANPYISNQNQVNTIGGVVNGFEIDSLKTGKVLGNPAIDPYDIIEIYDDENSEELIIARTLANYSLTYNGVITNIYDTQIGLEARKENVSVNSEPTFKKWATTEINNLDASIKLSAGKISTLEEKTNTQTEQINSLELTATSTTSKISNIEKDLSTTNQNLSDLEKEIQGVSVDFENFKDTEYAETIQNIQDQLDGAIQFWSGTETPTLNNFPANEWTTEALKNEHQGDIYDVLEGETIVSSYKFIKIDGVYEWRIMSDSEISAVKQLAQEALNKANQNKSDIEVINGSVTELQQTDKEIKASVSEIKTEVVPTGQASGSNIHIRDSADAELLDFKLYGKSVQDTEPTPDAPVEIESVGYTNLFNNTFNNLGMWDTVAGVTTAFATGNQYLGAYCKVEENKTYSVSREKLTSRFAVAFCNEEPTINSKALVHLRNDSALKMENITVPTGYNYLVFYLSNSSETTDDINLQVVESPIAHTYIPFGKYGVEVNINNENLFNKNTVTVGYLDGLGIVREATDGMVTSDFIMIDSNNTYYLPATGSVRNKFYDENKQAIYQTSQATGYNDCGISNGTSATVIDNIPINARYIRFSLKNIDDMYFIVGNEPLKNFVEYKTTQVLIQTDYPLMSNKDETIRDYLYLQNGNLYFKKQIGEISFDGSSDEYWTYYSANSEWARPYIGVGKKRNGEDNYSYNVMSNKFKPSTWAQCYNGAFNNYGVFTYNGDRRICFLIKKSDLVSQDKAGVMTYFSNNPTKAYYILAEPEDILIAENVDSLITYKNVTNISTNDNLQPNMEVVYVKDNTLNDIYQTQNGMNKYYTKVENDAQLEIVSDEIKSSVTEINTTIDTIRGAIETINQTMLTQTADQFEMLFKQTGIKELVDSVDALTKSNNATLVEQEQWIRFKGGNIELGRSDSQVKLLLSNDKISFLTGGNESAYISNNQLYITDSTILNKLQVGHWETKEENGNLNTRWIEGVI